MSKTDSSVKVSSNDRLGRLPEPDFLLDGGRLRCYYGETVVRMLDAERDLKPDRGAEVQALTLDPHRVRETEQRLRRQLAAAQVLVAGLEHRAFEHGKVVAELSAQAADVASERAANALLTAEIEARRIMCPHEAAVHDWLLHNVANNRIPTAHDD